MSNVFSRRSALAGMANCAGLFAAGSLIRVSKGFATNSAKIQLQLGWTGSNGQIAEIAADHLGYFAEYGLALEIIPGGPNVDGVATVASGSSTLGQISSSPSVMLARSAGIPIKCVAAGYQQHPFAFFSLAGNPVRTPQDMIGKRIGTNGTSRILLRALFAKNDIPEDQVEIVVTGGDMVPLVSGQVDAQTGWVTNTSPLKVLGDDFVTLRLWDAGIQLYANVYYTTDSELDENADQIANYLAATGRGWQWVHQNPSEAVDVLVSRYPSLDRTAELDGLSLLFAHVFTPATLENGWGTMNSENWAEQIRIYDELAQFTSAPPSVEAVMTTGPLESSTGSRPKLG